MGSVAAGKTRDEILREYPSLEAEDIAQALSYTAWRADDVEAPGAATCDDFVQTRWRANRRSS